MLQFLKEHNDCPSLPTDRWLFLSLAPIYFFLGGGGGSRILFLTKPRNFNDQISSRVLSPFSPLLLFFIIIHEYLHAR